MHCPMMTRGELDREGVMGGGKDKYRNKGITINGHNLHKTVKIET